MQPSINSPCSRDIKFQIRGSPSPAVYRLNTMNVSRCCRRMLACVSAARRVAGVFHLSSSSEISGPGDPAAGPRSAYTRTSHSSPARASFGPTGPAKHRSWQGISGLERRYLSKLTISRGLVRTQTPGITLLGTYPLEPSIKLIAREAPPDEQLTEPSIMMSYASSMTSTVHRHVDHRVNCDSEHAA